MKLPNVFAALDQYIEQQMRANNIPGLALALTDREHTLHIATYGFADLAARTPVTPETLFEIGSIGKSFTSIALLRQHEAGRIDLHQPPASYLPWFQLQSPHAPITLHHLMSHTAGIRMGADFDPCSPFEIWALRDSVAAHPPGAHFHYSNDGYKVLGLILERQHGQQYGAIIRSHILQPLGMEATAPVFTHATRPRMAVGYGPLYDDRPEHRDHPFVPATWIEYGGGDGSIASTPGDMAIYVRMLLNRGAGPRGRIISEESFAMMSGRVIEVPEWQAFYGYGLTIQDVEGHVEIGHGGGMIGYYSTILADLDAGFGAVVLINGPGEPYDIASYALRLLRAAQRNQDLPPVPAPPDAATLVENATDYAGIYRHDERTLTLIAENSRLLLDHHGERITLERRGTNSFYAAHPDFDLFLLCFTRVEDQVVEVSYGPDWYHNEHYAGPSSFDYPAEWAAYPGHYRAHNPWFSNFRVVLRKGTLLLIRRWGKEEPMAPLEDGSFRVGDEDHSPERIRFDAITEGQALRANLSGGEFYRFFTP